MPVASATEFFMSRCTRLTSDPTNSLNPPTSCIRNSPWWMTNLRSSDETLAHALHWHVLFKTMSSMVLLNST